MHHLNQSLVELENTIIIGGRSLFNMNLHNYNYLSNN